MESGGRVAEYQGEEVVCPSHVAATILITEKSFGISPENILHNAPRWTQYHKPHRPPLSFCRLCALSGHCTRVPAFTITSGQSHEAQNDGEKAIAIRDSRCWARKWKYRFM